jgi:hypothetical protein
VLIDQRGVIFDASEDVRILLGTSKRALGGRNLYVFFDGDRRAVMRVAAVAVGGHAGPHTARIRPRDRKPVTVRMDIVADDDTMIPNLRWTLRHSDG